MTDKDIKDYCKNCDVEPPAMRFKCPECEHNPDNENNLAKDINVPHKEQIIIDGVVYYKQQDINKGLDEEHYVTEFHLLATHYNQILEDYARKTQECEELKERKLKLELNENHNKNEIKKLKKRIRKDREFFKNKISSLTLARKEFLEALDHFNWQIGLVKNDSYRKALDEIEDITQNHIINDFSNWNMGEISDDIVADYVTANCKHILDIINKAKGEGNV